MYLFLFKLCVEGGRRIIYLFNKIFVVWPIQVFLKFKKPKLIFLVFHSATAALHPPPLLHSTVALTPPLHCSVFLPSAFHRHHQHFTLSLQFWSSFTVPSSTAVVIFCSHILVFHFCFFSICNPPQSLFLIFHFRSCLLHVSFLATSPASQVG